VGSDSVELLRVMMMIVMLIPLMCCCSNEIRHKTLHSSPWRRQSPARRAVVPDAEVHQILSSGGATGGGAAARRRGPVVKYGRDLLSPGKLCQLLF